MIDLIFGSCLFIVTLICSYASCSPQQISTLSKEVKKHMIDHLLQNVFAYRDFDWLVHHLIIPTNIDIIPRDDCVFLRVRTPATIALHCTLPWHTLT